MKLKKSRWLSPGLVTGFDQKCPFTDSSVPLEITTFMFMNFKMRPFLLSVAYCSIYAAAFFSLSRGLNPWLHWLLETYGFLAYEVLGNAMNRCFSTKCCLDKGHSSVAIVIVWLLRRRRRRQRWWGKSSLGRSINLILLTSCENRVVKVIFLFQILFFSLGYSGRFFSFLGVPRELVKTWKMTQYWTLGNTTRFIWELF